jgi:hypothetical protein
MIVFACGGCGARYSVEPRLGGRTARCRDCGAAMQIPLPMAAAAPVYEEPIGPRIDLDALGLSAAPAGPVLGGGYALRNRPVKRRSSSGGMLWLALGGGALAAVLLVVGAVAAIAHFAGGGSARANAAAYLPANWSMAMSIQPAELFKQVSRFPKAKPYIDQALAQAAPGPIDVLDLSELLIATEGSNQHFVAIFNQDIEPARVFAGATACDSHQGLTIYQETKPGRPGQMYSAVPQPRLVVGANQLDRLKAMLDQAAARQPGAADLPSGGHFVMCMREFSQFARSPLPAPMPWSDLRSLTLSALLSSDLSINVVVQVKDAQTAASLEQKAKQALDGIRQRRQQMAQAVGAEMVSVASDRFRIYATGSQLRITGTIPVAQFFDKLPPPDALKNLPAMQPNMAPPQPGSFPMQPGPMGVPR